MSKVLSVRVEGSGFRVWCHASMEYSTACKDLDFLSGATWCVVLVGFSNLGRSDGQLTMFKTARPVSRKEHPALAAFT